MQLTSLCVADAGHVTGKPRRTDSRYVPNDHELLIEKMLKDAARKGTSQGDSTSAQWVILPTCEAHGSRGEITPEILKAAAERVCALQHTAAQCRYRLCSSATCFAKVRKVRARVFDDKKVTDHYAIIPTSQGLDQAHSGAIFVDSWATCLKAGADIQEPRQGMLACVILTLLVAHALRDT